MNKLQVILVCGGSCSGKSTLAHSFRNSIVIELDSFYNPTEEIPKDKDGNPNFDVPEAIDIKACADAVNELVTTGKTEIPQYSMMESKRVGMEKVEVNEKTKLIVIEGIFAFHEPLYNLANLTIFMDTPVEIRVSRRLSRDIERKGFSHEEILRAFIVAEENYHTYIEPLKEKADLVIPFSSNPIKML